MANRSDGTKLTAKQELFIQEYLIDLNATQAAIRAGYSKNTATIIGHENLSKPYIQEAISEAKAQRQERTEITQDMVVKELARIAFLDIRKAFDENGDLLPITDMPEDVARAIGGMDISQLSSDDETISVLKKIKLIDKKGALELLGRHMAMFTDKKEVTGPEGKPIQVMAVEVSAEDAARMYNDIIKD